MNEPSVAIDHALDEYHRGIAMEAIGREGSSSDVEQWLLSSAASEALLEAGEEAHFVGSWSEAVAAHRHRIAARRASRGFRARFDEVLRGPVILRENPIDVEGALARLAGGPVTDAPLLSAAFDGQLRAAIERWRVDDEEPDERMQALDDPREPDAIDERASAFLRGTEELFEEALGYFGAVEKSWSGALRAFSVGDEVYRREGRWRRLAELFDSLGFKAELQSRVRVERARGVDPRPRVATLQAPLDVRLIPSRLELGLPSELFAMDALWRALAQGLVTPALPAALRRPAFASVGCVLGSLGAQVLAERRALQRLERAFQERMARSSGALWIAYGRWLAACTLCRNAPDEARERVAAYLSFNVGPAWPLAEILSGDIANRFEAYLVGLEAWGALRERFNEDWYRNPRTSELLRALASRGGALSCSEVRAEIGCVDGASMLRAKELFPT